MKKVKNNSGLKVKDFINGSFLKNMNVSWDNGDLNVGGKTFSGVYTVQNALNTLYPLFAKMYGSKNEFLFALSKDMDRTAIYNRDKSNQAYINEFINNAPTTLVYHYKVVVTDSTQVGLAHGWQFSNETLFNIIIGDVVNEEQETNRYFLDLAKFEIGKEYDAYIIMDEEWAEDIEIINNAGATITEIDD